MKSTRSPEYRCLRSTLIAITCWSLFCSTAVVCVGQASPEKQVSWEQELDKVVAAEMADWHVPGLAIAIVENDQTVLMKGYGVENIESGEPIEPESTVFHVASISKPITATAILRLSDRGHLDLHLPVNRYLPAIQLTNSFNEYPTAAQLLVHAGGLDIKNINRVAREANELDSFQRYIQHKLPPIIYPPGTISIYSNHEYALLGYLISEVSGQPFTEFMDQELFQPLGMKNSSFAIRPRIESRLATGYGFGPNAGNQIPPAYIKTIPASMLRTTVADISLWMRAILNGGTLNGTKILEPTTAQTLLRRQYSNHPLLPGRSYGLSEGERFSPPEFLHSGAASGFTSALVMLPDKEFGVFVAANSNAYLWGIVRHVLDQFESKPKATAPTIAPNSNTNVSDFVGHYRQAGIPQHSMFKLGNVIMQTRIGGSSDGHIVWSGDEYLPVESLAFRHTGTGTVLAFKRVGGRVRYLFAGGDEYVKIPWYQNRILQIAIVLTFIITAVATFIGWLLIPIFKTSNDSIRRSWPFRLAAAVSAIQLLFFSAIGYLLVIELGDESIMQYGVPIWFRALQLLIWVGFGLTLLALIGALAAGPKNNWNPSMRRKHVLVSIVLLLLIPYCIYWNLLI